MHRYIRHPNRLAHAGVLAVAIVLVSQDSCPPALYLALALALIAQLVVGVAADEAAFASHPRLATMYRAYADHVPYRIVPWIV